MRSVTGPSEVTKGNKIFAKTALGSNFEKTTSLTRWRQLGQAELVGLSLSNKFIVFGSWQS